MSINLSTDKALPVVTLHNEHGCAKVALFGGHVLSYIPGSDQQQRLWVSEQAKLDGTKAIRGGIPVCWPWFSDAHGQAIGTLPSHGYVRTQYWQVLEQHSEANTDTVVLAPQSTTGPGFNFKASLRLTVTLGEHLRVTLTTTNEDERAFELGCALHTYFAVDDIATAQLKGLEGNYKDKTRDWAVLPTPQHYGFEEETDRVHLFAAQQVDIVRHPLATINVGSDGHDSVVVWNPWEANSRAMSDMTDDGFKQMVCVETALTQGFTLAPGESHSLTQIIS